MKPEIFYKHKEQYLAHLDTTLDETKGLYLSLLNTLNTTDTNTLTKLKPYLTEYIDTVVPNPAKGLFRCLMLTYLEE